MLIIDRIEDGFAVIEDEDRHFEVAVTELAEDVREGDAVILENGVYIKDISAAEKLRGEILKLQNDLWE